MFQHLQFRLQNSQFSHEFLTEQKALRKYTIFGFRSKEGAIRKRAISKGATKSLLTIYIKVWT